MWVDADVGKLFVYSKQILFLTAIVTQPWMAQRML